MNPMLQNLTQNRTGQNLQQVKNMMNTLRSSGNPQMMLQQMVSQNPQMQEIMKYIQANGNDPKKAFYDLAKKKGIDPTEILNLLK